MSAGAGCGRRTRQIEIKKVFFYGAAASFCVSRLLLCIIENVLRQREREGETIMRIRVLLNFIKSLRGDSRAVYGVLLKNLAETMRAFFGIYVRSECILCFFGRYDFSGMIIVYFRL